MNSQAIPQWKVIKLIMGLRGRHIYYNHNKSINAPPTRTWSSTYRYNRDKVLYRHGYRNRESKKTCNEWNNAITFQKSKLSRRFDIHNLWRQKEYEQLEKMNLDDYQSAIDDTCIWKITIKNQTRKLDRLFNKTTCEDISGITWKSIIDRTQKRHSHILNQADSPQSGNEVWRLVIMDNKEKISRHHSKYSWDYIIYENFQKLKRRFMNES